MVLFVSCDGLIAPSVRALVVTDELKLQYYARVQATNVLPDKLGHLEAVLDGLAAPTERDVLSVLGLELDFAVADIAVEVDVAVGDADLPALVVSAPFLRGSLHLLTNCY